MNGSGKSDRPIVPQTPSNKGPGSPGPAERVEGRGLAKENPLRQNRSIGHRAAPDRQTALQRIRQAAEERKDERFTALWHHVCDAQRLREAYFAMKRTSAAGVDQQTWQQYGRDLEANLRDLSGRLHRGGYHAKPVKRAYVPKSDGRLRAIGIPTLEDKIVQRAAASVLGSVYEADFMDFSYGFRPGRGCHEALDALSVALTSRRVNWVLDADIRGFFDTLDHGWLIRFVEHRIADPRVLRHLRKWLNAGVLEDGTVKRMSEGTPQGGSISPLLANVYLHYAFDLWADHWRWTQAVGDVIIVRYADDFVVGFEHRADAERFQADLAVRLAKFNLELHPEKTRLLEFGRFAAAARRLRGEGKPETFDFLGLTHSCSRDRRGRFIVLRRTMRQRQRAKLGEIKRSLARRMHAGIRATGRWLRSVVQGHYRYYGVPRNGQALKSFRFEVLRLWRLAIRRRSQKARPTWAWMQALGRQWLPYPTICHPYPEQRLRVSIQGKSPVR